MERPTKAQTLRVFFALVPDAATQALLDVLARDVAACAGGRAIVGANIHLTLAFVGAIGSLNTKTTCEFTATRVSFVCGKLEMSVGALVSPGPGPGPPPLLVSAKPCVSLK